MCLLRIRGSVPDFFSASSAPVRQLAHRLRVIAAGRLHTVHLEGKSKNILAQCNTGAFGTLQGLFGCLRLGALALLGTR